VLPRIVTDLHVSIGDLDQAAWLVTAYLLGFTAALPIVGRLADAHGLQRAFAGCAALFAAGSLWGALAPDLWQLVAARGVQAVGGGGMVPIALAAVPARRRLLGLGVILAAAEAGSVLGPLYGALMVHTFGWRSVFWINLPLTGLVLLAVVTLKSQGAGGRGYLRPVLAGVALGALAVGLAGDLSWRARAPALALAAVLALALHPRVRRPSPGVATNFFVGAALIVALVILPVYANVVRHVDATHGALTLVQLTALIPVGALLGARFPRLAPAGMLLAAAGFVWLSQTDRLLGLDLGLMGLGFGLVLAPVAEAAIERARGSEAAAAAALTVGRMVGMMVGLASLTSWGLQEFNRRAGRYPLPTTAAERAPYERHLTDAALYVFGRLYLIAAALCVAAALAALLDVRDHVKRTVA
jgi:MFS family permease